MSGTDSPRTAGEWLQRFGWQRHAEEKACWWLQTEAGRAALWLRPVSSSWQAWYLHGGGVLQTSTARLLRDNGRLAGPCKFVRRPRGGPVCRADLPLELLSSEAENVPGGSCDCLAHPVETWARDLTALASGKAPSGADPLTVTELAGVLEKKGWSTTSDQGTVRVHVPLPGVFRQVTIETAAQIGTRLGCELVDLAGWPTVSRRAALYLAHQANVRLHLVRFALAVDEQSQRLRAEVNLASARVPRQRRRPSFPPVSLPIRAPGWPGRERGIENPNRDSARWARHSCLAGQTRVSGPPSEEQPWRSTSFVWKFSGSPTARVFPPPRCRCRSSTRSASRRSFSASGAG